MEIFVFYCLVTVFLIFQQTNALPESEITASEEAIANERKYASVLNFFETVKNVERRQIGNPGILNPILPFEKEDGKKIPKRNIYAAPTDDVLTRTPYAQNSPSLYSNANPYLSPYSSLSQNPYSPVYAQNPYDPSDNIPYPSLNPNQYSTNYLNTPYDPNSNLPYSSLAQNPYSSTYLNSPYSPSPYSGGNSYKIGSPGVVSGGYPSINPYQSADDVTYTSPDDIEAINSPYSILNPYGINNVESKHSGNVPYTSVNPNYQSLNYLNSPNNPSVNNPYSSLTQNAYSATYGANSYPSTLTQYPQNVAQYPQNVAQYPQNVAQYPPDSALYYPYQANYLKSSDPLTSQYTAPYLNNLQPNGYDELSPYYPSLNHLASSQYPVSNSYDPYDYSPYVQNNLFAPYTYSKPTPAYPALPSDYIPSPPYAADFSSYPDAPPTNPEVLFEGTIVPDAPPPAIDYSSYPDPPIYASYPNYPDSSILSYPKAPGPYDTYFYSPAPQQYIGASSSGDYAASPVYRQARHHKDDEYKTNQRRQRRSAYNHNHPSSDTGNSHVQPSVESTTAPPAQAAHSHPVVAHAQDSTTVAPKVAYAMKYTHTTTTTTTTTETPTTTTTTTETPTTTTETPTTTTTTTESPTTTTTTTETPTTTTTTTNAPSPPPESPSPTPATYFAKAPVLGAKYTQNTTTTTTTTDSPTTSTISTQAPINTPSPPPDSPSPTPAFFNAEAPRAALVVRSEFVGQNPVTTTSTTPRSAPRVGLNFKPIFSSSVSSAPPVALYYPPPIPVSYSPAYASMQKFNQPTFKVERPLKPVEPNREDSLYNSFGGVHPLTVGYWIHLPSRSASKVFHSPISVYPVENSALPSGNSKSIKHLNYLGGSPAVFTVPAASYNEPVKFVEGGAGGENSKHSDSSLKGDNSNKPVNNIPEIPISPVSSEDNYRGNPSMPTYNFNGENSDSDIYHSSYRVNPVGVQNFYDDDDFKTYLNGYYDENSYDSDEDMAGNYDRYPKPSYGDSYDRYNYPQPETYSENDYMTPVQSYNHGYPVFEPSNDETGEYDYSFPIVENGLSFDEEYHSEPRYPKPYVHNGMIPEGIYYPRKPAIIYDSAPRNNYQNYQPKKFIYPKPPYSPRVFYK